MVRKLRSAFLAVIRRWHGLRSLLQRCGVLSNRCQYIDSYCRHHTRFRPDIRELEIIHELRSGRLGKLQLTPGVSDERPVRGASYDGGITSDVAGLEGSQVGRQLF